jgi:small conductance mechanosensitive channel
MPKSAIMSGAIVNYSRQKTRRIDLVIGVSYESDLKQAKAALISVLDTDTRILKEPEYTVAVSELADSSVNFVVRPWVKTEDYWPAYFDLVENIKIALDEANIAIPYPQMDVHLHKD